MYWIYLPGSIEHQFALKTWKQKINQFIALHDEGVLLHVFVPCTKDRHSPMVVGVQGLNFSERSSLKTWTFEASTQWRGRKGPIPTSPVHNKRPKNRLRPCDLYCPTNKSQGPETRFTQPPAIITFSSTPLLRQYIFSGSVMIKMELRLDTSPGREHQLMGL